MKENIIVECRCHWKIMILPSIVALLFLFLAITQFVSQSIGPGFVLLVFSLLGLLSAIIRRKTTKLILTENTVVGKVGLVRTIKQTSPIGKVQDVSVRSGLLGKIFHYATITVNTAGSGTTEYIYKDVTNAEVFQQEFLKRSIV